MKIRRAKKIIGILDRINVEVELLGKIILQKNVDPVSVPIKVNDRFKFKG